MNGGGAHLLPPGAASTLHSLTKLAQPVDGTIVAGADGVSRITTRASGARKRTGAREEASTNNNTKACVTRYRILSPVDVGAIGTTVEGRASLRGLFVSRGGFTVGVAASISGALGPSAGQRGPTLVAFNDRDRSVEPCSADSSQAKAPLPSTTEFSTQTTLMPLAPLPSTVEAMRREASPRLLVACANGVFALQALPSSATTVAAGHETAAVLTNLVETVRYVVDGRPSGSGGGFLCRLTHDAIAVLPGREDSRKAAEIQRALRAGPYRGLDVVVHSGVGYVVSQSLLEPGDTEDPQDPTDLMTLRQAAESVLGAPARVRVEPLAGWQAPPVALDVTVVVSPTEPLDPAASAPVPIEEKFLLHGGQLGVSVRGSRPTVRPLRFAEEPGAPENHFSRILSQTLQSQLARLPNGAPGQDVLDATTKATAAELRELLTATDIFAVPVEVRMSVKQLRTPGVTVSLPSGLSCVVPAYASEAAGPRLSAVLGALPSLGVGGVFVPWGRAEVSGVPLGW